MGNLLLRHATITFSLKQGDDKDDDTAVSVFVGARYNNAFDMMIASRQHFADTDTWEDTGNKSYAYDLKTSPVALDKISGDVTTTIQILPYGKDTVKFGYDLELQFVDDQDSGNTQTLTQKHSDITLDQNNSSWPATT